MNFWRDIDTDRRMLGLRVWLTGVEIILGRSMFRVRWGA